MPLDRQTLYRQLGRHIEAMPEFAAGTFLTRQEHEWLARAYALVEKMSEYSDTSDFKSAMNSLITNLSPDLRSQAAQKIYAIVYRALAVAEMEAPAGAAGTFIPVGNSFDAFAALSKILQSATKDALIVDPFMDETALTEFGLAVPEGVTLRLLTDESSNKPTLAPAATKWASQYGARRPLAVRLAVPKTLHDRAIFTDGGIAWTLTQSLKDFAKRSPAEIVRADDTANLKIAAYEAIWRNAKVLV